MTPRHAVSLQGLVAEVAIHARIAVAVDSTAMSAASIHPVIHEISLIWIASHGSHVGLGPTSCHGGRGQHLWLLQVSL